MGDRANFAQVDEVGALLFRIRHNATAPISSHTTFNDAEGMAPCHQPLITKPAAPTMFMPWYMADWPVSLPIDRRR